MKKKIVLSIIALVLIVSLSLWYLDRMAQERERELQRIAAYADAMHFITSSYCSRGVMGVSSRLRVNRWDSERAQFTEIVFVHSSEEAEQFGEHVLVAWPQENNQFGENNERTRGTQYIVDLYNEGLRRMNPDIDLRDYGLPENKITVADTVDNWEIVREIWRKYRLF